MNEESIKKLLEQGENIEVEFKRSSSMLGNNVFESICAFLNRHGGHLLLGITDTGEVEGVQDNAVQNIVNNIINSANNPLLLTPTIYLSPEVIFYEGKHIIYVFIPESSTVHKFSGKIFDRNKDGDYNITANSTLVTDLYVRKQETYSENKIYPFLSLSDLKEDLFVRVRKLAANQRLNHTWLQLDNMELIRSAGLYQKDYQKNIEGFSLAAVLLFGKDEVIQQILPHYKTDAIFRINNEDRYDDRDYICTNLIDSYDRLMAFVEKHLPDKFFQDKGQRINVRDIIFREVIANMLVHREFSNAFPAKLIIEKGRVVTENWNKPHIHGLIDPKLFAPFPKNPTIARFFKEIGRVEELGSGVRNIYKYTKLYTPNSDPKLEEGDIFKAFIPIEYSILKVNFHDDISSIDAEQKSGNILSIDISLFSILNYCKEPRSRKEILHEKLGLTNQTKNFNVYIMPLLESGLLERTRPKSANAPNQKYVVTNKGLKGLEDFNGFVTK